jgi:hypothetical protein
MIPKSIVKLIENVKIKCDVEATVDPSLFMLVHGRTAVLDHGRVPMDDGGLTYPTTASYVTFAPTQEHPLDKFRNNMSGYPGPSRLHDDDKRPFYRWSNRFQWLPCEVEFTGGKSFSTDVRITSYINNLTSSKSAGLCSD